VDALAWTGHTDDDRLVCKHNNACNPLWQSSDKLSCGDLRR
jgi:hypothetical protein